MITHSSFTLSATPINMIGIAI